MQMGEMCSTCQACRQVSPDRRNCDLLIETREGSARCPTVRVACRK